MSSNTISELQASLGENLRQLRLNQNLDRSTLAERAGMSLNALKNLENGAGATLKTLIAALRALGREDWLKTIAPISSINPLTLTRAAKIRERASRKITKK